MTDFAHLPKTIRIGDLEVCRLGFGAMQLPGPMVWGEPKDVGEAKRVLGRAVEHGINLIDTSWYYGPLVSNRLIKEVLHPYREGLVLATKLGGMRTPDKGWGAYLRPEEIQKGCDEDLRSLGLERLDVVHLRWMNHGAEVPFKESLDAMIALQREGKIRHIGLSNVTYQQLLEGAARTKIVTVQNLYNVVAGEKRIGESHVAVVADQDKIVDWCEANGVAFLPFFPLSIPGPQKFDRAALAAVAKRHGVTESQVAIAWLLGRSKSMLPIPGTSKVAHLDENWAARTISLTKEEMTSIASARG